MAVVCSGFTCQPPVSVEWGTRQQIGLCYALGVHPREITSAGEFLDAVRELRNRWRLPDHKELWFRGEDLTYDTVLRPTLYRPLKGKAAKSVSELLEIENSLYSEFERCAAQLCEVRPGEDWEWEWYFLMQHHGVPTRLLDWTDGGLIGLHFAVRNKVAARSDKPLVFVLDPYWLSHILKTHSDRSDAIRRWEKFCAGHPHEYDADDWDRLYLPADEDDAKETLLDTPQLPLLWDSAHVTRRIAAQRSRFMIFGSDPNWLIELAQKKRADSRIQALCIEPKAISGIRHDLRDAGVTESVIFPDLDGLGRELSQVWEARVSKTRLN